MDRVTDGTLESSRRLELAFPLLLGSPITTRRSERLGQAVPHASRAAALRRDFIGINLACMVQGAGSNHEHDRNPILIRATRSAVLSALALGRVRRGLWRQLFEREHE